jgi:cell wall-associated NlpC family hydrolase
MRESQLRRSVLPLSAVLATGALVLANAPTASAATTADAEPANARLTVLNEKPVPGQVAATATESDTESRRQTRKTTVTVTRKLTPKIKAAGKGTSRQFKTAKATRSATSTRYAPTYKEALAEAQEVAELAAHKRAARAAKARAGKLALAEAKKVAKVRARHRADINVRNKFGTVVLRKAKSEKGKPYRWGATGPSAFDCSGLVGYVMKHAAGINLPRTANSIAHSKKVHRISKSHKKRGDLIFFASGSHVYHVAIYAGHGMIWHAPGSGKHVQKAHIWTSGYQVGRLA